MGDEADPASAPLGPDPSGSLPGVWTPGPLALLGSLVIGGRGALTCSGCSALVAGVIGPGVILVTLVPAGTADTGQGLAEGGGHQEGGQEHDRGAGVGCQLDHPDAAGA